MKFIKTIWHRQTGVALHYDTVDAREILASAPELYTDVNPHPPAEAGPLLPQNVSAADEYRREPVGENFAEAPLAGGPIIRNATGAPRPDVGVPPRHDHFVRPKDRSERAA